MKTRFRLIDDGEFWGRANTYETIDVHNMTDDGTARCLLIYKNYLECHNDLHRSNPMHPFRYNAAIVKEIFKNYYPEYLI